VIRPEVVPELVSKNFCSGIDRGNPAHVHKRYRSAKLRDTSRFEAAAVRLPVYLEIVRADVVALGRGRGRAKDILVPRFRTDAMKGAVGRRVLTGCLVRIEVGVCVTQRVRFIGLGLGFYRAGLGLG